MVVKLQNNQHLIGNTPSHEDSVEDFYEYFILIYTYIYMNIPSINKYKWFSGVLGPEAAEENQCKHEHKLTWIIQ